MRWFWVDRFSEFVAGSHAVGHKGVALSDDFMHDHWDAYPVMPHSLIAEGMAQTGGLLVSELYQFKELVVLAKFSKLSFHDVTRGGEQLTYRAEIVNHGSTGAVCRVTGHVDDQLRAEAEIFFARMQAGPTGEEETNGKPALPARLFDPEDLCHWLHLVGVFDVGVHADGRRMSPHDYQLPVELTTATN